MFTKYLRNEDPDLLDKAGMLEIELAEFDPIFRLSPGAAKKALQSIVNARTKPASKSTHVRTFVESNARDLADFYRLKTRIQDLVNEYNGKNTDAHLKFYPISDQETKLIRKYSPKGESDSRPRIYDLKTFAQKAKDEGYDLVVRISPSGEGGDYHTAKLQPNGMIVDGKVSYHSVTEWVRTVYDEAIKSGLRTKRNSGNRLLATTIQNKKSGEWEGLGAVYNRLMGSDTDGAEKEEDLFDEEETEE